MPRFRQYKYDEWAKARFDRFMADRPSLAAVDTETSGVAWGDEAFCVTFSWRAPDGSMQSAYLDLESDESGTRHEMARQMLKMTHAWLFHNCKFDLQKLELAGILSPGWNGRTIEDTQILYSLLNENDRKGLKYLAKTQLGLETNEEEVLAKVRRKLKLKKDDGYHLLPRQHVAPYAMRDTELTLLLYEKLMPKLPEDLADLYDEHIEHELVLLSIEGHGIGLDVPYLKRTASEYGMRVMKGELKLAILAEDPDVPPGEQKKVNWNSPKQVMEAFERRGVKIEATDKATLASVDDELAATLLQYRSDKKMHSTYLVPLLKEQTDGVIHPNFNSTLPRTGRMSSGGAHNH